MDTGQTITLTHEHRHITVTGGVMHILLEGKVVGGGNIIKISLREHDTFSVFSVQPVS